MSALISSHSATPSTPRALAAVLVVLVMIKAASPVQAQQNASEGAEQASRALVVERAQRLYNQGLVAYEAKQYERAITKMRESYALVPDPLILHNLTWVLIQADQVEEASATARALLSVESSPKLRLASEARLAALDRRLHAARIAEQLVIRQSQLVVAERKGLSAWTWVGAGIVAVSVAPLALAAIDSAKAKRAYQLALDLNEVGLRKEAEAEYEQAQQAQRRGRVWLAAGSFMTAAGLVTFVLNYALSTRRDTEHVGVTWSPSSQGFTLHF